MTTHSDEVIVARALDNGWEQVVDEKKGWSSGWTRGWTGWKRDGQGIPVGTFNGPQWKMINGKNTKLSDGPYEVTWADAMRDALDHDDQCAECGRWIEYMYMTQKAPAKYCWHCAFWLDRLAQMDSRRSFVSESNDKRVFYTVGDSKSPGQFNGYGGTWFTVEFSDGRTVKTCDLWCGGDIPERFWDRYPVSGRFADNRLRNSVG